MLHIIPVLQYNSIERSPFLTKDNNIIESVHRYFTKHLFTQRRLSHCILKSHLTWFKLDLLE